MNTPETARQHPHAPEEGDVVVDGATGRVGRVLGPVGGKLRLRPVGGGDKWDADPDNITFATDDDVITDWQKREGK